MTKTDSTRRNIMWPDALWEQIVRAAGAETTETGKTVTVSEWVREAARMRLEGEK